MVLFVWHAKYWIFMILFVGPQQIPDLNQLFRSDFKTPDFLDFVALILKSRMLMSFFARIFNPVFE